MPEEKLPEEKLPEEKLPWKMPENKCLGLPRNIRMSLCPSYRFIKI
ncbi:hypothetical protein J564_3705 [Acinetobacter baumannii 1525283]|nr:hypothetical protein J564_3705 [Acinetobacter baumannii 1525283]